MIPIFILSCQNTRFDIKDSWYNKTNDSIKVINKVNLEVEYEELIPKQRAFIKMRKPVFDEYEEIWIRKK